jgi:hypothetical protein
LADDNRRFRDDAFAPSHLPVAQKYPERPERGRLYAIVAISLVLVILPFLVDALFGTAGSVSDGPLSGSHALFGNDCTTCHTPGEGTPDVKCKACHEKSGDAIGNYTWAQHYLYRSADFDRSAPSTAEVSCSVCHTEHQGRNATLTRVADARCGRCHEQTSLDVHSEFDFIAESVPDPANLQFTHVTHVREVMDDDGLDDIEASCLRCHEAEPAGRFFQPVSFERHCDACHLTPGTSTPQLPLASGGEPGVLPLAAVRADPEGIAIGADYWDPSEFRERAGFVQKRPVYHADPWILLNLRRLRSTLYPGAELAALLDMSADVPASDARLLHDEALETLRSRIRTLRGEPSRAMQDELEEMDSLLALVERRMEDPYAPVDRTRFDVRVADRSPELDGGSLDEAAWLAVVDSLTSPCTSCHVVERATILRVQTDQGSLVRADFDHRAHILHARCLDCHTTIPIRDWFGRDDDPPPDVDASTIQNVPSIETGRGCHAPDGSPDRCIVCHAFDPDDTQKSNLSRVR